MALAFAVALSAVACRPQIGDSCESSVNCSATGERLCDITQPGGYCTVFNCEPGSCPDGSVCVAFGASLAKYDECRDVDGLSRFERTYCVASCDNSDDCRAGYACENLGASGPSRNAVLIDTSKSAKVCLVALDPNAKNVEHESGVCTGATSDSGPASGGSASTGSSASGGSSASEGSGGAMQAGATNE